MSDFFEILKKSLFPESILDVILYALGLFLFISSFMFYKILKLTMVKRIFASLIIGLVPAFIYFSTLMYFVPWFQAFDEDRFSILFARFSGARAYEYFGETNFNEILERELQKSFEVLNLRNEVATRSISFITAKSGDLDSKSLMKRFNSLAIVWGNLIKLEESIHCNIYFDFGPLSFIATLPNKSEEDIVFDDIVLYEYELIMTQGKFDLSSISEKMTNDISLLIAAHLSPTNLSASEKIVMSIPGLNERTLNNAYEPFTVQLAAFAFARHGDTLKAMELYDASYGMLQELKSKESMSFKPDKNRIDKIGVFAGVSKYQEGNHALFIGDTLKAINLYRSAAMTSKVFSDEISKFMKPIIESD